MCDYEALCSLFSVVSASNFLLVVGFGSVFVKNTVLVNLMLGL